MKILVIGKSGQLAWELSQLSSTGHEIVCLGRNDVDIASSSSLTAILITYKAEAVINASA